MKRKVSYEKYFIAAVISFLIFFLGLSLGMILTNERLMWLESTNKKQEVDYQSLQFQYLYLLSLENTTQNCGVFQNTLDHFLKDLSISLDKFVNYEEQDRIKPKEFDLIGRTYIIDNLKYFLMIEKTKETCDADYTTILYFFSGTKCSNCPDQGVLLTYFKRLFGDSLLIFPIDVDYAEIEPVVQLIMSQYNITSYPSIVVDEKRYDGVVQKKELGSIICSSFEGFQGECSRYREAPENE